MTGNNYLLDTNVVIELFKGNKAIADKINKLKQFYISSVVLGELYIGINRVANKSKHLKKLNDFLELCTVINIDSTTAKLYGEAVAALYIKGNPIPTNDIWIAATALQHNLTLVTADNHFKQIDDLTIKSW
jgi:tRNA(fMet)-specific endonuclease VapC